MVSRKQVKAIGCWAMWIHMNSLLHCLVVIDNGFAFAGAYLHKTLANHGGSGGGVENKKKRNWKLLLSFQPYYELSHSCRKSKTFFIIVKKVKQAGLWHSEIVHELLGLQHCLNEVEGCVAVWACVRKEHVHLEISHWHIWKYSTQLFHIFRCLCISKCFFLRRVQVANSNHTLFL